MTLNMKALLPPGSHAWCQEKDCGWTNLGQDCHRHGKTHSQLLQHVVNVWEPPEHPDGWVEGTWACGAIRVNALLGPIECVRAREHEGQHYANKVRWT